MSFLGVPGGYDGTRVTKYTSRPNRCILHAHDHDDHHDHPRKSKKKKQTPRPTNQNEVLIQLQSEKYSVRMEANGFFWNLGER